MNNKLKIIRFFIENKEENFSINSIANNLKLNYRIAFEDTKKLEAENIVSIKKFGNTNQCSFNYKFNEKVLLVENNRKQELLKNQDIKVMYNRLMEIKNPFFICLVFGSYVKGMQKKHSDIDLCIISDDKIINEKINQIIRTLALEIHLLEFTTNEFVNMLRTKEQNVGKEIINNNIILKNVEGFYELINYAG